MPPPSVLPREEHIEQMYFFRVFLERLGASYPAQEVLERIHEEILSTTRLPLAIQFLATELKHSGTLSSGFGRLSHYFTPFQTFVIQQTEVENRRFGMETALQILEREAQYRAGSHTAPGLFIYQFESLCRNKLGYDEGLTAIAGDPFYNADWSEYIQVVRRQVGLTEFSDLLYARSEYYVNDQKKLDAGYEPPFPPLFGEKEGKIARANRGKDPLYLFAALQRQLGYPEVPRAKPRDDLAAKIDMMNRKLQEIETRIKLIESEARGHVDLSQFGKPEILDDSDD